MTNIRLSRSSPEQQGIASAAILKFVERADREINEMHSFMLVRHGEVVAEGWWAPYGPQKPHILFSLSKSFASSAVGLVVEEGRLSVDDRVVDFFPEETPAKVSKNLAAMRVRDLLTMTTGHSKDATQRTVAQKEGNWVKGFLSIPVRYRPGTHFVYNSAATYMLSAIVQKLTGMTMLDYLTPRLFEPLGIDVSAWDSCPRGINIGGWGLKLKTEDIACFGQMYLQKGAWRGRQILSPEWVAQASARQVSNGDQPDSDWSQGYGYQFWRCRHNIYRGDGAFGQYCIVMPEQDAVLAITSGVSDMQAVLNLVWEELLPAMGVETLPADLKLQKKLGERLDGLALEPPQGEHTSPLAGSVSGETYQIKKNGLGIQNIRLDFEPERCQFKVSTAAGEVSLACGYGTWLPGTAPNLGGGVRSTLTGGMQSVLSSGVWTTADTFQITVRLIETPFYQSITCRFEDNKIKVSIAFNLSFNPTEENVLEGEKSPGRK